LRILHLLLEFILFAVAAILVWEMRYRPIEQALAHSGVELGSLRMVPPLCLEATDIRYRGEEVARRVHFCVDPASLVHLRLRLYDAQIERLDLNALERLAKRPKTSSKKKKRSYTIPFEIADLRADAIYRYRGLNTARLKASRITLQEATIEELLIDSFAAKTEAKGRYEDLRLTLTGRLWPKERYLKTTLPPSLNPRAIRRIDYDLNITKKELRYTLAAKATKLYKDLNATLKSRGLYRFAQKRFASQNLLHAEVNKSRIQSDFNLSYAKKLAFAGDAKIESDPYPLPVEHAFYKELFVKFAGDPDDIDLQIRNSLDFAATATITRRSRVRFSTRPFALRHLAKLPPFLEPLHLQLSGLYEKGRLELAAKSELAEADIFYQKPRLALTAHPKPYRGLRLDRLDPLTLTFDETTRRAQLESPLFKADANLSRPATLTAALGPNRISARYDQKVDLAATIASIEDLIKRVQKVYPLPDPGLKGGATLTATVDPKSLAYRYALRSEGIKKGDLAVDFIQIEGSGTKERLHIDYYALYVARHGLYATKRSTITFKDGRISLEPLWIYDAVKITGSYKAGSGEFAIDAKKFRYSSIEGVAVMDMALALRIEDQNIFTEGLVSLREGKITFEPKAARTISDPDIIVVDAPQKSGGSFFKEHVALAVKIESKRPILYAIKDLEVYFVPNILLWKELQKDLEILGIVKITRGLYTPLGERYEIRPSEIYFYGRPHNPYLDLHIKTRRQSYTIYITISGSLANPIITFDSDPYLPQKDILPLLLFGSSTQSMLLKATGGDRLVGALGNIFLKNLLKSFGIHLDTLTLTTHGNRIGFEIGKRISDKITVVYKNDEVSTIIVRYRFNDRVESEVYFGPQRSGANIFYRTVR